MNCTNSKVILALDFFLKNIVFTLCIRHLLTYPQGSHTTEKPLI